MKKCVVFLASLCLISFVNVASAQEVDCDDPVNEDNPRCHVKVDDEGDVKTKSGKAERTFSFPSIKQGYIFDFYNPNVLPYFSIEALEFDLAEEDFAIDIGSTVNRVFGSLTWEFIPIAKVGISVWGGYNVIETEPAFGVGVSILDF